jgi:chemotaxis signal transduction protein
MTASKLMRQLVVFSLHGEQYAVPIGSVREIIRYTKPTPVGASRGLIQGMINLRGRVLTVVDLSGRLGHQPEIDGRTQILVLEVVNGTVGLIVDMVDGVREIPAADIQPLGVAAGEGVGDEIAAADDRLVVLLDLERTLGGVLPSPPAPQPPAPPSPAPPSPAPQPPTPQPPTPQPPTPQPPTPQPPTPQPPTPLTPTVPEPATPAAAGEKPAPTRARRATAPSSPKATADQPAPPRARRATKSPKPKATGDKPPARRSGARRPADGGGGP